MPRSQVAPTRSNLLRLQDELETARRGHDLLDEKRRAMILELMTMIEDAEAGSERMTQDFVAAYHALYRVRMTLGTEKLNWIALSAPRQPEIDVEEQHIMGVRVPIVHAGGQAPALQYGLGDTAVTLDEAVRRFRDLLPVVYEMAEMLTAVWRLTREIRKTQRHVKALENVVITRVESGIRFIEDTLEEKEREEFFRAKRIKEQIEAEER